ncbi:MAG: ABC transporter permease, partial [Alphaproteobacteria bacterium]
MKVESKASKTLLQNALTKIVSEKISLIALIIVVIYFTVALLTSMGVLAGDWGREIGESYMAPNAEAWMGTDIFGRSVILKTIKATETAVV